EGRLEAFDAKIGGDVVLIDAVAGDAEATHQNTLAAQVLVGRRRAREEDDAVLVGDVARIAEVALGIEGIKTEDALECRGRHRRARVETGLRIDAWVIEDREWPGLYAHADGKARISEIAERAAREGDARGESRELIDCLKLGGIVVIGEIA